MESLEERLQRETREKVYNLVKEVHIQKPFEDVTGEPHYVTNEIMKIISHTISETIKAGVSVIEGEQQIHKGCCPECRGDGFTVDYDPRDPTGNTAMQVLCHVCDATGVLEMPNVEYNQALQTAVTKLQELGK